MKTILNLAWKELIQLYRDRLLLAFLIVVPMMLLILIAQSTGAGISNERLAVWDQDRTPLSQQLIEALDNTGELQLAFRASSFDELRKLVNRDEVSVAVIIPPNFAHDATRPDIGATVPVIVDGSNAIVANDVLAAMNGAVENLSLQFLAVNSATGLPAGVDLKVNTAFNPTLSDSWTTLPTTLAFITYVLVLIVAAVSFVRERELGTMEQLAVTPINRLELLLGKGLMVALVGLLNFFVLVALLTLVFQIPMRGDLVVLVSLGFLFIVAEIGVGMLISLLSTSQQQAVLVVFMLALSEVSLSGILVPTDNMPVVMRVLADFSPLQHFTSLVRAIFLKGAPLDVLMGHVVPLALLACGTIGLSWVLFNRIEW